MLQRWSWIVHINSNSRASNASKSEDASVMLGGYCRPHRVQIFLSLFSLKLLEKLGELLAMQLKRATAVSQVRYIR